MFKSLLLTSSHRHVRALVAADPDVQLSSAWVAVVRNTASCECEADVEQPGPCGGRCVAQRVR